MASFPHPLHQMTDDGWGFVGWTTSATFNRVNSVVLPRRSAKTPPCPSTPADEGQGQLSYSHERGMSFSACNRCLVA